MHTRMQFVFYVSQLGEIQHLLLKWIPLPKIDKTICEYCSLLCDDFNDML